MADAHLTDELDLPFTEDELAAFVGLAPYVHLDPSWLQPAADAWVRQGGPRLARALLYDPLFAPIWPQLKVAIERAEAAARAA